MAFQEFRLEGDYVELNLLLKLVGIAGSGGEGKRMVADGRVAVDGAQELRKTYKVRAGQVVTIGDEEISVLPELD
ncbi:RNA-binding S4 domain-containing protein [Luteibacter sp.]|jgi:ribosome-associated protein|uniref:RNA-binding S4 domain-containing protein n=1 Tax=Luteibacter sp. TaxID=1886636 RepID=UPI002F40547D